MGSQHEEIDPIKSNPASHKAIGVVAMVTLLVGLGYWLGGSPYTRRNLECAQKAQLSDSPSSCCAGGTEKPDSEQAVEEKQPAESGY